MTQIKMPPINPGRFNRAGKLPFLDASKKFAQFLYRVTNHPNILTGELFVSVINGVAFKGRKQKILGVFKSERKSNFIELRQKTKEITAEVVAGLALEKLDKGVLFFLDKKMYVFLCATPEAWTLNIGIICFWVAVQYVMMTIRLSTVLMHA